MVFVVLGVLLLLLKLAGLEPVAGWSWFVVLAPFVLAPAWWVWSDRSGRARRQALRKDQARKDERRRNLARGMGLQGPAGGSGSARLRRQDEKAKAARQRQIDKIEGERARRRQANRDSILTTRMDSEFDSQSAPASKSAKP